MAKKCVVCGRDIDKGITCDRCEKPRIRSTKSGPRRTPGLDEPFDLSGGGTVVPFPDSVSIAMKSVREALAAARVPAIIFASNRTVKFISDDARSLLGFSDEEQTLTARKIEGRLGMKIPPLGQHFSASIEAAGKPLDVALLPLVGGADGAALIFPPRRQTEPPPVLEKIFTRLRALREALSAAVGQREKDPLLDDTAATIDQILVALDAPTEPDYVSTQPHKLPASVPQVVHQVAARYTPIAALKGIQLQVDMPELHEIVREAEDLEDVLEVLVENSLQYVPRGGQIFLGARTTSQKNQPVILFFVMDNGPGVPDELRKDIFRQDFDPDAHKPARTGKNLPFCHMFAARHGGQCWVESKQGKTCTFFLSMKPGGN
jgi:hypothetical protein